MQRKSDDLLQNIYEEIKSNSKITEREIAKKFFYSERTIRRYIKVLKEENKIEIINTGRRKVWKIL